MAVKTFYVLGTAATSPGWFGALQDGGTAPTAANATFGYAPGKLATSGYCRSRIGASGTSATSQSTPSYIASLTGPTAGTGATNTTSGDSFITPAAYTGLFASGNWTFTFNMIATTAGLTGRLGIRVWASANTSGTSARELTSGEIFAPTAVAGIAITTSATALTATWAAPAITLNNEYLFFQLEYQESSTTSGSATADNALFRVGSSIATTNYSPVWQGAATLAGAGALTVPLNLLASQQATLAGAGALQISPTTIVAVPSGPGGPSGSNVWYQFETFGSNLISGSSNFSATYWTVSYTTLVSAPVLAPDGTNTTWKLTTASVSVGNFNVYSLVSTTTPSIPYVLSAYFKQADDQYVYLGIVDNSSNDHGIYVDMVNGTVTASTGFPISGSSIQNVGNGWWRAAFEFNLATTGIYVFIGLSHVGSGSVRDNAYPGTGSNGTYVWGVQLEQISSTTPSNYTPTTDLGGAVLAIDSSGLGRSGVVSGAPLPVQGTGWFGQGMVFAGPSGGVAVPAAAVTVPTATSSFTVAAWMKTSYSGDGQPIFSGRTGSSSSIIDLVQSYNGVDNGGTNTASILVWGDNGIGQTHINGTTAINDNVWHHVCAVFDGSGGAGAQTLKLYVDGTQQGATATAPLTSGITLSNAYVGREYAQGWGFTGTIDEFRFYPKALTASDIASLMTTVAGAVAVTGIYLLEQQTALFGGVGTLSTDLTVKFGPNLAAISFTGNTTLTASARLLVRTSAALSGTGALTATLQRYLNQTTATTLSGVGSLTADVTKLIGATQWQGSALLSGAGQLGAAAKPDALLHFDGVQGATTVVDSGNAARTWTITLGPPYNPTAGIIDTAQSEFGGSAFYDDGTCDLRGGGDPALAFGTGDFTVDFWLRQNGAPTYPVALFAFGGGGYAVNLRSATGLVYTAGSASDVIFGTATVTVNAWHHLALTRASGTTYLFFDGVLQGSPWADTNNYTSSASWDPTLGDSSGKAPTWFDECRILVGQAVWISNFTPPSQPYALIPAGVALRQAVAATTVFAGVSALAPFNLSQRLISNAILAGTAGLAAPKLAQQLVSNANFTAVGTLTTTLLGRLSPTAAFTGVGTFGVNESQWLVAQTAAWVGSGTLTADVTKFGAVTQWQGTALFAGVGTLTTTTQALEAILSAFAGVGALTAITQQFNTAQALFTGVGSLAVAPLSKLLPATTLAGAGQATFTATQNLSAQTNLAGVGAMTVAPLGKLLPTTTFAGVGQSTFNSTLWLAAQSNFAGAGGLTIAALGKLLPTTTFAGAATLNATANVQSQILATLAGAGAVTLHEVQWLQTSTGLSGAGSLTADVNKLGAPTQWSGVAQFAATGGLTVGNLIQQLAVPATLSGVGSLQVTTQFLAQVQSLLVGLGSLTASALVLRPMQAAFAGLGTATATATVQMPTRALFGGAGALVSRETQWQMLTGTALSGAGSLTADVTKLGAATQWQGTANFAGSGSISASFTQWQALVAGWNGAGTLNATMLSTLSPTANFAGAGTWAPPGLAQWIPDSAQFNAVGNFTATSTLRQTATTLLTGVGGLTIAPQLAGQVQSQLSGIGGMTVLPLQKLLGAQFLAGNGILLGKAQQWHAATLTASGTSTLTAQIAHFLAAPLTLWSGAGVLTSPNLIQKAAVVAVLDGAGGLTLLLTGNLSVSSLLAGGGLLWADIGSGRKDSTNVQLTEQLPGYPQIVGQSVLETPASVKSELSATPNIIGRTSRLVRTLQ